MKKKFFAFVLILFFCTQLLSFQPPILLDVKEQISDSVFTVEYQLENFQNGIMIKINIFQKRNLTILSIDENGIKGDFGKIEEKNNYRFEIPLLLLPNDFDHKNYTAFPRIIFQGRIYYEMKKVEKSQYYVPQDKEKVVSKNTDGFYISKFEASNEQFAAFINYDGYEIKEYWLVKEGIMENQDVGWNFQGKFKMYAPREWDLKKIPYCESAPSNFIYGPVTNLRWFEANAFCNWMGCSLPNSNEISICFSFDSLENDTLYNPVCKEINEDGQFPLHFIKSNVSEWLIISVESKAPPCGPGCREMFYLKNNAWMNDEFPINDISCPLYCNEILGFRYKIVQN